MPALSQDVYTNKSQELCKTDKFYIHLHRKTEKYIGDVSAFNKYTNVPLMKSVHRHSMADSIYEKYVFS